MSEELAIYQPQGQALQNIEDYAMTADVLLRQANIIEEIASKVMKPDMHYGLIPGCGKRPSLLKPGAEKLIVTFRLSPDYEDSIIDLGNGHREYKLKCILKSIVTGAFIGSGVGSCSTMESKYRFRTGEGEVTDVEVPKKYWDTRKDNPGAAMKMLADTMNAAGYDGEKFGTKKGEDKKWYITTHGDKVEHDNPADYYNTVYKMAKKRALIDAVLTATAASDVFTQDIEDLVANGVMQPKEEKPQSRKPSEVRQPQEKTLSPEDEAKKRAKVNDYLKKAVLSMCENNPEDAESWLQGKFKKSTVNELTNDEARSAIEMIEAAQKAA